MLVLLLYHIYHSCSVDTLKNVDVLMVYPIHVIFSVTDVVNNLVLMVYTCNIFSNRCGQQFSLLQFFRSYIFTTFVIRFVVICGIVDHHCLNGYVQIILCEIDICLNNKNVDI